ncbi:MAG: DUF2889 domain-containing protein [Burkholderiaceae bacterium]
MPLPPSDPQRQLKHQRAIQVQAYARADGLWEIDAFVRDSKTRPTGSPARQRPAGEPIHDLHLRILVDAGFNIVASGAESLAMPYPGHCDDHGDRYAALAGLNLMRGFKRAVRERLGGVRGCTHLTELADVLPTAVVQAFAGEVLEVHPDSDTQPFQIDRCHALASDGEAVRLHYPRWFRQPGANKLSENPAPATPSAPPGD